MIEVKLQDKEGLKDVPVPEEVKEKMYAYFGKQMKKFFKNGKKKQKFIYKKLPVLVTDKKNILLFGNSHFTNNLTLFWVYTKLKILIAQGLQDEAWDKDVYFMRGLTNLSKFIGMSEVELMARYIEKVKGEKK